MKNLLLLFLLSLPVFGTLRYVDSLATGSNDGTTWANAYTNPQSVFNVMNAGDTVYLRNNFVLSKIDTISRSGSSGSPILIIGCNASGIDNGTIVDFDANNVFAIAIVTDVSVSYLKFKNIRCKNATQYGFLATFGIDSSYFTNCEFNNNGLIGYFDNNLSNIDTFYYCKANDNGGLIGSATFNGGGFNVTKSTLFNCVANNNRGNLSYQNGAMGIQTYMRFVSVVQCTTKNNGTGIFPISANNSVLNCLVDSNVKHGIITYGATQTVTGNHIMGNGGYGLYAAGGSTYEDSNYFHNNYTADTVASARITNGGHSVWAGCVRFVDSLAVGLNSGVSWTNAYRNPQSALNVMKTADTILLRGNFSTGANNTYGGLGGTASSPITIIGCNASGVDDGTIVNISATSIPFQLASYIVTGTHYLNFKNMSFSNSAGGFWAQGMMRAFTFTNCRFNNNAQFGIYGGSNGLGQADSGNTFINCQFNHNQTTAAGGFFYGAGYANVIGYAGSYAFPTTYFKNCQVIGNGCSGRPDGGLGLYGNVKIDSCVIDSNYGYGIRLVGGTDSILHSKIRANIQDGIYSSSSVKYVVLIGDTISRNTRYGINGIDSSYEDSNYFSRNSPSDTNGCTNFVHGGHSIWSNNIYIDSLSPTLGRRSSSVRFKGLKFTTSQGNGHVQLINFLSMDSITTWNDSVITAVISNTAQRGYYIPRIRTSGNDSVFCADSFRILVPSAGWGN